MNISNKTKASLSILAVSLAVTWASINQSRFSDPGWVDINNFDSKNLNTILNEPDTLSVN